MRALLLVFALGGGCAPIAQRTMQSAVHGTLEGLTDPQGEAMLIVLEEDARLTEAARRLGQGALQGVLAGLSDEEQAALLRARSEEFVDALGPRLGVALGAHIGPALRQELVAAVSEATLAVSSDQSRRQLSELSAAVSRAIVDTLGPRLRAELQAGLGELGPAGAELLDLHLGPALNRLLTQSIGPGLQTTLQDNLAPAMRDHLNPALTELTRASTAAMLEELRLALDGPLGDTLEKQRRDTLDDVNTAADAWVRALGGAAGALGLGLIGALAFLRRTWRTSDSRLQSLELLTGVIKEQATADPELVALVDRIRTTGRGTRGGQYLSEFLDEKRHLKVKVEGAQER